MPRLVDHEERRREIALATWQAIDELGVDGVSMRAIAERAGCTTGRLNHYFDRREDMLVAALRLAHEQAGQRMQAARRGRTGRDALRAVLHEALPLDARRRTEWKVWLAFWAQAIATESLQDEQHQRYVEWRALLTSLVADADPGRRPARVARAVDVLVAAIDGVGTQAIVDPTTTPARLRAFADDLVDRVLPPSDPVTGAGARPGARSGRSVRPR